MGDRTCASVEVLAEHATKAAELLGDDPDFTVPGRAVFFFEEINGGWPDGLDHFKEHGIPFTNNHDAGAEYEPAFQSLKFHDDGTPQYMDVPRSDENPDLMALMRYIEAGDDARLKMYITNHYNATTPLEWDNQADNAKKFLTRQLIHAD